MQLSIDHDLGVAALLATFARDLADLEARHWCEFARADARERLRLRAEHAGRVAGRFVAAAARLAELGSAMRAGFSRLLTEQLASGNHGLMDAFQAFFAVLPEQDVDFQHMLGVAVGRTEAALGEMSALLAPATNVPVMPARKLRPVARTRDASPSLAAHATAAG